MLHLLGSNGSCWVVLVPPPPFFFFGKKGPFFFPYVTDAKTKKFKRLTPKKICRKQNVTYTKKQSCATCAKKRKASYTYFRY